MSNKEDYSKVKHSSLNLFEAYPLQFFLSSSEPTTHVTLVTFCTAWIYPDLFLGRCTLLFRYRWCTHISKNQKSHCPVLCSYLPFCYFVSAHLYTTAKNEQNVVSGDGSHNVRTRLSNWFRYGKNGIYCILVSFTAEQVIGRFLKWRILNLNYIVIIKTLIHQTQASDKTRQIHEGHRMQQLN